MAKTLYGPEYTQLRQLLVAARERAGLTQAELAARLNRAQSFVSKYEKGERRLDVVEFVHACSCIGVDAPRLLADAIKVRK